MLEAELEDDCCGWVESRGGVALKIVSPGRRGRLDRLFILPGPHFVFVEFKRFRGRETRLQGSERRRLKALGVACYVCRSHREFAEILRKEGFG